MDDIIPELFKHLVFFSIGRHQDVEETKQNLTVLLAKVGYLLGSIEYPVFSASTCNLDKSRDS